MPLSFDAIAKLEEGLQALTVAKTHSNDQRSHESELLSWSVFSREFIGTCIVQRYYSL
jgi:hypothetical protein